jgi:ABC-type nitrate/sulfonate/bicarbonate transport system permease component
MKEEPISVTAGRGTLGAGLANGDVIAGRVHPPGSEQEPLRTRTEQVGEGDARNAPVAAIREWWGAIEWRRGWRSAWRGARRVIAPTVVLALLIAAWQAYVVWGNVDSLILPAPSQVWQATLADWPNLWPNLIVTLQETAIGFGYALLFGALAAALLDLIPSVRRAFYPIFVASQSIPLVALAPLLQLWFGPDLTAKVIVIVLVCFFPITVAGLDGLRATDPDLIRLYRSFGASPWRIFRAVRLPNALPALFSGIRIAITYSVIGAIFSEYTGANQGLGIYLRDKQAAFQIDLVIGTVAVAALVSIGLFVLVQIVERLAIPWFYAARKGEDKT